MIEAIIVVAKAQLKIAEEKLKKSKRKLKDEEEGKKSPKDIVEHKKEEDKDPEKKEKEVKKKKIKVNAEFVKVQALRVKILVLQVIKYIVMIIEQFVMFLIATFGALGLFIVLVVLVLMIAIYGFLHIDMTVPNGEILNSSGNQYENNCIQGGQVINSDTANLDLSTLEGALTGYQKDVLNVFQLYDEFIKGEGSIQPITKGFNADVVYRVYRGIPLSSSKQYSLFGKSNVDNKIKENSLSYDLSNSAEGTTLSSYTIIDSSYIESWKGKYSLSTSDNELYWAPYSVAISVLNKMQMSESIGTDGSNESAFKTYVESQMTSLGIVENANECYQYIQAFVAISASEYGVDYLNVDANTYGIKEQISYLCMLFANSSDSDGNRHFYNYKIDTTQTLEYKEDIIWDSLMGSNSLESADLSSLSLSDKYFKVNNENIDKPIISFLYDKFAENTDVIGFFTKIVGDSNSLNLVQSYSRGFTYLVVSDYMANILAKSAPLVVGTGSPYDCDCYTDGSYTNTGVSEYRENNAVSLSEFKENIIARNANIQNYFETNYSREQLDRPVYDEEIIIPKFTKTNPLVGTNREKTVSWNIVNSTYSDEGGYSANLNSSNFQNILPGAMSNNENTPYNKDGLAFYKGRYLVATGYSIGVVGDIIDYYFDNGIILPCIVGDVKMTTDPRSVFINGKHYGHTGGRSESEIDSINVLEFIRIQMPERQSFGLFKYIEEKYGWVKSNNSEYRYANVVKVINHGNVFEDISLVDKYFSEDGNLSYSNISTSSNVDCIGSNGFVETPGQFQGPWKNRDMLADIDSINDSSVTAQDKVYLKELVQYVGTKPANEKNEKRERYFYTQDIWATNNGLGFVRYCQGWTPNGVNKEKYNELHYSVNHNFRGYACGLYSAAAIISTMKGLYVNPAEMAIASATYNVRNPNSNLSLYNLMISSSAGTDATLVANILRECSLTANIATDLEKNKVDEVLNSGGMVFCCVHDRGGSLNYFTDGGHFVVIREKYKDKYLFYSSTNWVGYTGTNGYRSEAVNKEFTWNEVLSQNPDQVIYVLP